MELKDKMKEILLKLKKLGFERKTIEKDLCYAPHFITRNLSNGGSNKFYKLLEKYYLQKTDPNLQKNEGKLDLTERLNILQIELNFLMLHISEMLAKVNDESSISIYLDLKRQVDKALKKDFFEPTI